MKGLGRGIHTLQALLDERPTERFRSGSNASQVSASNEDSHCPEHPLSRLAAAARDTGFGILPVDEIEIDSGEDDI